MPTSLRAEGEEGGNAVGFVWATLATDVAEPRTRLAEVHASMVAAKAHLASMSPTASRAYSMLVLAPAVGVMLSGIATRIRPPMNVTISNVPGPREARYFNGARLEAFYPISIPFQGMTLNITCVSYDGQFNIGFTGSRDRLPHLQRLAGYACDALAELEATLPSALDQRVPAHA